MMKDLLCAAAELDYAYYRYRQASIKKYGKFKDDPDLYNSIVGATWNSMFNTATPLFMRRDLTLST